ncbi:hypothetical protein ACQWTT_001227 [Acinetobacter baumannii]
MNKVLKNSAIGKDLNNLSESLYVLSQVAKKRKSEISHIIEMIKSDSISETELNELQNKLKQLSKAQQYFHAERTEIFRFLIHSNLVNLKGYVTFGGYNYGIVKMANRQFYIILNKKLIQKFKLQKLGEGLDQFETLAEEQLNEILSIKEAEKIFKQSLAKIRSIIKKANKAKLKSSTIKNKDQILSKSQSSNGSIVVVKKRKFSGLAASNKS